MRQLAEPQQWQTLGRKELGFGKDRRERVADLLQRNLQLLSPGTPPAPLPLPAPEARFREEVKRLQTSFLPALLLDGKEVTVLGQRDDNSLLVACPFFEGTAACRRQFVW